MEIADTYADGKSRCDVLRKNDACAIVLIYDVRDGCIDLYCISPDIPTIEEWKRLRGDRKPCLDKSSRRLVLKTTRSNDAWNHMINLSNLNLTLWNRARRMREKTLAMCEFFLSTIGEQTLRQGVDLCPDEDEPWYERY